MMPDDDGIKTSSVLFLVFRTGSFPTFMPTGVEGLAKMLSQVLSAGCSSSLPRSAALDARLKKYRSDSSQEVGTTAALAVLYLDAS